MRKNNSLFGLFLFFCAEIHLLSSFFMIQLRIVLSAISTMEAIERMLLPLSNNICISHINFLLIFLGELCIVSFGKSIFFSLYGCRRLQWFALSMASCIEWTFNLTNRALIWFCIVCLLRHKVSEISFEFSPCRERFNKIRSRSFRRLIVCVLQEPTAGSYFS